MHDDLRNRALFDRPYGVAGHAVEHERHVLLGQQGDRLDRPAVNRDVVQDGRSRRIVIPQAMMDDLKMPDSFAGPCVQADDALAEKIVAEPMPAVEVMRRGFHRQIDIAQFRVGAHHRPDACVTSVFPRAVFPGFIAELARLRDRVKSPEQFAGSRIVSSDVSRRRFFVRRCGFADGLSDDDVTDYRRRRR